MSKDVISSASVWKGQDLRWLPKKAPDYDEEQLANIARYEADLAVQLEEKPKRLRHSLSVGLTAERMAVAYGVDPYLARVAGILHDWSKAESTERLAAEAVDLGISFEVDMALVEPLLHGMVAARMLPSRYPELPAEVFQAIDRHTLGNAHMSELDMVVFVADGIEPFRKAVKPIESQRGHVGKVSLEDLFWESFADGVSYVIDTRRYLYPGTLDIYNEIALERAAK
jgi:predicted HD superfamily hydrolase involved in NAD metabolism